MTTKRRTRKTPEFAKPRAEYEVGKGRPPKATRWQPGQSGNLKGRPRAVENIKGIFQQNLQKTIVVQENGKKCRMTALEAIALRQISLALKGDQRVIASILAFQPDIILRTKHDQHLEGKSVEELTQIYHSRVRSVVG